MKVDVYDTYAASTKGLTLHFDVLVPNETDRKVAYGYAVKWLDSIGEAGTKLSQSRCNFCHSENASPIVVSDIESEGFHIIQMEGCPNPVS